MDPGVTVDQKGIEAYLYSTSDGYVINLLNSTYDVPSDSLTSFENIEVTLNVPDGRDVAEVILASPDTGQEVTLSFEQQGDKVNLIVPSLWVWDMVFVR